MNVLFVGMKLQKAVVVKGASCRQSLDTRRETGQRAFKRDLVTGFGNVAILCLIDDRLLHHGIARCPLRSTCHYLLIVILGVHSPSYLGLSSNRQGVAHDEAFRLAVSVVRRSGIASGRGLLGASHLIEDEARGLVFLDELVD